MPQILFSHELATNYQEKPNTFTDFFGKQYQPLLNNITFTSTLIFGAISRQSTADIDWKKILKLIWSLNSEKAHGRDGI